MLVFGCMISISTPSLRFLWFVPSHPTENLSLKTTRKTKTPSCLLFFSNQATVCWGRKRWCEYIYISYIYIYIQTPYIYIYIHIYIFSYPHMFFRINIFFRRELRSWPSQFRDNSPQSHEIHPSHRLLPPKRMSESYWTFCSLTRMGVLTGIPSQSCNSMVHLKFMAHPKKIGRLQKKKHIIFLGFHLQLGETVCYLLCFLHFFAPLGSSAEILKQCLCTPGTGTAAVGPDCPVYQARAGWRLSDLPTYRPTLGWLVG